MSQFEIGDRVEVIPARGFCECDVGRKFVIGKLDFKAGHLLCPKCAHAAPVTRTAQEIGHVGSDGWAAFEQLRKLPPLAGLESAERRESCPAE
jgi:hypothetical protein